MEIEKIETGYLQENCYLIKKDNKCLIVDPGDETNKIISKIGNLQVLAILVTHHHFDHVGALKDLINKYNAPVYDYHNSKEQDYEIGPFSFELIYNPGHSEDSVSFYFKKENVMFVGDFVFLSTIGRCDLEGGNYSVMKNSIEKLKLNSENIILYPGHGEDTTLNFEKENNPYFS